MVRALLAAAAAAAALAAPAAADVDLPPGHTATRFASGLHHPTAMAFGPDGLLYVAQDDGRIAVVSGGRARTWRSGLRTPLGLVWIGRNLYVAESGRVSAWGLRGGRRVVLDGLPFGLHQQNGLVLRRGRLYLGSGSTCDVCRERSRLSAAILSFLPNGRDLRVEASGLRNPFGLAVQPGTGRLYASVNAQDRSESPAESVVLVERGRHFGWPRCYPHWELRRLVGSCRGVTPPVAYLEPHSSADGMAFWRGDLFVAEWGQYLTRQWGRKIVRVRLSRDGRRGRVLPFATGLTHPLALAVHRGALLVADWETGEILRIRGPR